jgi:hypothetical protein
MIGVGTMLAMLMLIVASISGADLATWGKGPMPSSEEAVQAFAVMLMMAYTSFTVFTVLWRDTLLPAPMASQEQEGYPPAVPSYGGNATYDGANAPASYHDETPSNAAEGSSVL